MYKGILQTQSFAEPAVVKLPTPAFADARGTLKVLHSRESFAEFGVEEDFVLDLHVTSKGKNVLRGLHFQRPPHTQAKLLHVLAGRIWDVTVDLRQDSKTFGQAYSLELDAEENAALFIPEGFAHGYLCLSEEVSLLYKLNREYRPEYEDGILWSDPDLQIPWPLGANKPLLSDKDRLLPLMKDHIRCF